ncbi:ArsR/SmtB family transcription factor [Pararhizobium haloflavum]|uniref:ArsR/SmtB family transcription factor n=1 Tax=Pararhizobium haloflavum TaxID=2037914 RepID=UPI000C1834DF|nr:metalloregulator ArsR/SmtB family transcription factor [Pararhizobium haloflavum]
MKAASLDDEADAVSARRLQALGHPARLRILRLLSRRDACCCKDVVGEIGLAQSTVSQHLKCLVEAGLVRYRPDRQASRYSLDRHALSDLSRIVGTLLEDRGTAASGKDNAK